MFKKYAILLSLLLMQTKIFAQGSDFAVKSFTDPNILIKLFDSRTTIVSGRGVWKPNFFEKLTFNVSYDGRCYTNLDTIMQYVSYGKSYGLLIFTTYGFEKPNQQYDCHACSPDVSAALFAYDEDRKLWALEAFEKHLTNHGSWGQMAAKNLRKVGKEAYVLELSSCYMAMGEGGCATTFYEPDLWFKLIFSEKTHNSYAGGEGTHSLDYSWDKKLAFVSAAKERPYYDIVVSKTGRGRKIEDDYKSPIIDVSSTERYTFDETINRYVLAR